MTKRRPGQILILVLLIIVVALAVGLSVASRNITNLRTSTQTEQSQRAFSAAEGGVEDVLSRLSDIAPSIPAGSQYSETVTVGEIDANVNILAANVYEAQVEDGSVAQVDLGGYSGNLTVEWIVAADTQENTFPKPSLEVTFVSGTGGSYLQSRYALQAETIPGQDGFTQCTLNPPGDKYLCRYNFTAPASSFMARIKPFWKKATIKVTGGDGFPVQAYDVTSTATTDLGLTRRVQVTRTALPQLPAVFDYVLFSEEGIVK